MYKILVIENDRLALKETGEYLAKAGNTVNGLSKGLEGIKIALNDNMGIILCAVLFPGVEELERILSRGSSPDNIPFIFLSNESIINALSEKFDFRTDDYVVKSVNKKDIADIIEHHLNNIWKAKDNYEDGGASNKLAGQDKIMLEVGKEYVLIKLNHIVMISAKGNYTVLSLKNGGTIIQKRTLKSWETILPEKTFVRVHHNTIVNFDYIERIEPLYNGALILKVENIKDTIICSVRYSRLIKNLFMK